MATVDDGWSTVACRYNSYSYDGQKSVVLSTTTWLGVTNPFMGIVFIVTGSISVVIGGIYFIAATFIRPRKMGDLSVLTEAEWR